MSVIIFMCTELVTQSDFRFTAIHFSFHLKVYQFVFVHGLWMSGLYVLLTSSTSIWLKELTEFTRAISDNRISFINIIFLNFELMNKKLNLPYNLSLMTYDGIIEFLSLIWMIWQKCQKWHR